MEDRKKIPALRFKAFEDDWEEKAFKKVMDFSVPNNTLSRAYLGFGVKGEVKNVHYGDILVKYPSILDVDKAELPIIIDSKESDFTRFLLKSGDIVIADTAEDESTGKVVEMNCSDGEKVVAGLHTMVARPNKSFAKNYLGHYLNSPKYHNQLLPLLQGIKVLSLSKKHIQSTTVRFPNREEEQCKIGSLLTELDNLIALQQEEYELLKKLKKGYLQKLFPKKGESVPELRFEGFDGAWEDSYLGDFLIEYSKKSTKENEYDVLSSTSGGIEKRVGRVSGNSNLGYKILDIGDLVLSPQNLWLGNININDFQVGLVSPSYKTFKIAGIEPGFIRPILKTREMLEEYKNSSTQGASVVRRNLEIELFKSISIKTPGLKEQQQLSNFFDELDKLIKNKLLLMNQSKLLKKYLLNKLFN